jgi:hypothetical protein
MMTDNNNMRIWDNVSKTNPAHTTHVNQRGGFTAISAQYQIMSATEQFGPIGVGWGYECAEPIFQQGFIIVPVTIWHGERSNTFGPVYGCCEMFGKRPDSDAPKKATTDAITKGLSQLGFNADVFLGKFDDNKYVADLKKEFADPAPEQRPTSAGAKENDLWDTIKDKFGAATDKADLDKRYEYFKARVPNGWLQSLEDLYSDYLAILAEAAAK